MHWHTHTNAQGSKTSIEDGEKRGGIRYTSVAHTHTHAQVDIYTDSAMLSTPRSLHSSCNPLFYFITIAVRSYRLAKREGGRKMNTNAPMGVKDSALGNEEGSCRGVIRSACSSDFSSCNKCRIQRTKIQPYLTPTLPPPPLSFSILQIHLGNEKVGAEGRRQRTESEMKRKRW